MNMVVMFNVLMNFHIFGGPLESHISYVIPISEYALDVCRT